MNFIEKFSIFGSIAGLAGYSIYFYFDSGKTYKTRVGK